MEQKRPGQDPKRPGGEMHSEGSNQPTRSQLLPLGGAWQELLTKPYFVPGVIGAAGLALMWATIGKNALALPVSYRGLPVLLPLYYVIVALLLTAGGAYVVHRMVGKVKAWWLMPAVVAFTAFLTMSTVMGVLQKVFGAVQPATGNEASIVLKFVYNFFAAGLPEELLKAIPVAIGVYIGLKLMQRLAPTHPARQLAVIEPLDGILIGAASGLGFAFSETLLQYVPGVMVESPAVLSGLDATVRQFRLDGVLKAIMQKLGLGPKSPLEDLIAVHFIVLREGIGLDRATFEFQRIVARNQAAGLELMLPRLVSNVFGHAAYAGIFGYFIGLAALKPANAVKTILIGLAIACSLHAAWNARSGVPSLGFVVALAAFIGLAVVTIKARKISPERSQLIASQIVGSGAALRSQTGAMPQASVVPQAKAGGTSVAPAKSITWGESAVVNPPATMTIEIGNARVPATIDAKLLERQLPGTTASRGDGVVAEVNANPDDPSMIGLRNLSNQIWHVTTEKGERRDLSPGRSVRIARGMRILIGDLTAEIK